MIPNAAVLHALTKALSNDRFPVDGKGYRISTADRQRVTNVMKEQMLGGATNEEILLPVVIMQNTYGGTKSPCAINTEVNAKLAEWAETHSVVPEPPKIEVEVYEEWAQKNIEALTDLSAAVTRLRGQIVGNDGDNLEEAKTLQRELQIYALGLGLDMREEAAESRVTYHYKPSLSGAGEEEIKTFFGEAAMRHLEEDGTFTYLRGEEAYAAYESRVFMEENWADWTTMEDHPGVYSTYNMDNLPGVLFSPSVKELHFLGGWHSSEGRYDEAWGCCGSANWSLVAELEGGHFIHLMTSGGWQ